MQNFYILKFHEEALRDKNVLCSLFKAKQDTD